MLVKAAKAEIMLRPFLYFFWFWGGDKAVGQGNKIWPN